MTLLESAAEIAEFLDAHQIPYVVIGGLAVQYWGEPRTTRDVDVTVLVAPEQIETFVKLVLSHYPARISDAHDFALRHRVLLVRNARGIPLDISLGIPGYEEEVMRRAIVVHYANQRPIRFISAEDLIIHKCVAGRARDREDVERILIRQQLAVSLDYIRRWLTDFAPLVSANDVGAIFEEALRKAQQALENEHKDSL